MRTRLACGMVAFGMAAIVAMADYTTGRVTGLTAKQRYPWNGKVDISFTLSGSEAGYCIAVAATNASTGAEIPVRTLRDTGGNAISRYTKVAPGAVSLIWDAGADAPGIVVETLALSVVTIPPQRARVQLWEGGPYWATTNIGAEEPWEYGLYFWWGDTVGYKREGSAWVANNGSSLNFAFGSGNTPTYNKSISTLQSEGWVVSKDGTYVLAPAHDAAHVHWGGGWRMPTYQELDDLCNNKCDWTWTTQNGVNGFVVRGRDDYASASIFLPCAGYGYGPSLNSSYCGCWSSVPYTDNESSGGLTSDSGSRYLYEIDRHFGLSVRPVQGFAE